MGKPCGKVCILVILVKFNCENTIYPTNGNWFMQEGERAGGKTSFGGRGDRNDVLRKK